MQLRRLVSPKFSGWLTGWRPKMSSFCSSSPKARILSCSGEVSLFVLFKLQPLDEDHPCYGEQSADSKSKVNLIQKHLHRNVQNNIWPRIWALWPSQETHEINNHWALIGLSPRLARVSSPGLVRTTLFTAVAHDIGWRVLIERLGWAPIIFEVCSGPQLTTETPRRLLLPWLVLARKHGR